MKPKLTASDLKPDTMTETTPQPDSQSGGASSENAAPDWDALEGEILGPEDAPQDAAAAQEAADRELAKQGWYRCMAAALKGGGMVYTTRHGGPPLKSCDLPAYGEIGTKGSDQLFDRVYDVAPEFLKGWLLKLAHLGQLEADWGDVVRMVQVIAGTIILEVKMREAERHAKATAEAKKGTENESD